MTWNIVIGTVTGLITAAVLLILKSIFVNSFLPWYRQFMYKGLDLSGSWHSISESNKMLVELSQSCEKLQGKATSQGYDEHFNGCDSIDSIRTFDVSGETSERFVTLKMKHTDKNRIGIATYLLQVDGDGTLLVGQGCWYAPLLSGIVSGQTMFYRDEARAKKVFEETVDEETRED